MVMIVSVSVNAVELLGAKRKAVELMKQSGERGWRYATAVKSFKTGENDDYVWTVTFTKKVRGKYAKTN